MTAPAREGLLPCPFCGGLDAEFVNGADDDGTWVAVGCPDCGVGSRQHYAVMDDARPHAQNAWNTRATPPEPSSEVVEAIRHASELLLTLARVTRHRTIDPTVPLAKDILVTAERLAALASRQPTPAPAADAEVRDDVAYDPTTVGRVRAGEQMHFCESDGLWAAMLGGAIQYQAWTPDESRVKGFSEGYNLALRHAKIAFAAASPKAPAVAIGAGEVEPDVRAHLLFDRWDKHQDAPAYWFRLPSWVQEYATACIRMTEKRLAPASASIPADVEREALRRALEPFARAAKRLRYYGDINDQRDGADHHLYASRTGDLLLELLDGIDGDALTISHLTAAEAALAARPSTGGAMDGEDGR